MSTNIKDPEAHVLALQIAKQTGETMTRAVTVALRERLARLGRVQERETKAEDLLAIGRRCAATLKGKPVEHGSLLMTSVACQSDHRHICHHRHSFPRGRC